MTIYFFGTGDPIPTFIERRMNRLSRAGVALILVAKHGQLINKGSQIQIALKGDEFRMTFKERLTFVINLVRFIRRFIYLVRVSNKKTIRERVLWALTNHPLACVQRPDVIHFQWLTMADQFSWLRAFYDCPVVSSARGSELTVMPVVNPKIAESAQRAIEKSDFIHCVSSDIASRCKSLGAPPTKIKVNYNGIDTGFFKPDDLEKHSTFTLISVGSLIWRKGYIFQLLVLKNLLDQGLKVRLKIIGSGPEKDGLMYQAIMMGLEGSVSFVGRQTETEVVKSLCESHVYLSTSAAEGLANSVVESAACGLPAVVFDCEGMKEIIDDGATGFIVNYGDTEQMASKIELLYGNRSALELMGKKACEKSRRDFSEQYWFDDMMEFYKSLIR